MDIYFQPWKLPTMDIQFAGAKAGIHEPGYMDIRFVHFASRQQRTADSAQLSFGEDPHQRKYRSPSMARAALQRP